MMGECSPVKTLAKSTKTGTYVCIVCMVAQKCSQPIPMPMYVCMYVILRGLQYRLENLAPNSYICMSMNLPALHTVFGMTISLTTRSAKEENWC